MDGARCPLTARGGKIDPADQTWIAGDEEMMRRVMEDPRTTERDWGSVFTPVCTNGRLDLLARLLKAGFRIPAIGLVVSAIFTTDLEGAPPTATGHVHDLSFLANVVIIGPCHGAPVSRLRTPPAVAGVPTHRSDAHIAGRAGIRLPVPYASPRGALWHCEPALRRGALRVDARDFDSVARVGSRAAREKCA